MLKYFYCLLFSTILICNLIVAQPFKQICLDNVQTNEPSLAIDPHNPANQIIGSNVDAYFLSTDSGFSWEAKTLYSHYGVYGDPVVQIAKSGRYYYAHLSKTKGKTFPEHFDRIVFQSSDDQGVVFNNGISVGYNKGKMQDKPWFNVLSLDESDPNKDVIAITWTEFDAYKSSQTTDSARIRFAISTNGGLTFSEPITISKIQGSCQDNSYTPEGATPVVFNDGSIHVAWALNQNIYYTSSFDWGKSWDTEKVVANQLGGWSIQKNGFMRTNALPFLKAGHNNRLVLVWAQKVNKNVHHVFVQFSDDKGLNWSKPTDLQSSFWKPNKHVDAFLPYVAVDHLTGKIYIVYYQRTKGMNDFIHVGMAISDNNGTGFKSVIVDPIPFLTPGKEVFFGDYIAVDAAHGFVRTVWTSHANTRVFLCSASSFNPLSKFKQPNQVTAFIDKRNDQSEFLFVGKVKKRKFKVVFIDHNDKKMNTIPIKRSLLSVDLPIPVNAINPQIVKIDNHKVIVRISNPN
jgi:hypothetical protein